MIGLELSLDMQQVTGGGSPPTPGSALLLEDGSYLLLEDGSKLLLE